MLLRLPIELSIIYIKFLRFFYWPVAYSYYKLLLVYYLNLKWCFGSQSPWYYHIYIYICTYVFVFWSFCLFVFCFSEISLKYLHKKIIGHSKWNSVIPHLLEFISCIYVRAYYESVCIDFSHYYLWVKFIVDYYLCVKTRNHVCLFVYVFQK